MLNFTHRWSWIIFVLCCIGAVASSIAVVSDAFVLHTIQVYCFIHRSTASTFRSPHVAHVDPSREPGASSSEIGGSVFSLLFGTFLFLPGSLLQHHPSCCVLLQNRSSRSVDSFSPTRWFSRLRRRWLLQHFSSLQARPFALVWQRCLRRFCICMYLC